MAKEERPARKERPVPETRTLGTPRPAEVRPAEIRARATRPPAERTAREAPGNSLWLYGLHAVAAAMANPARHLRRLLLTEEAEAGIATRLRRPWALGVERVDRARLDHLLGAGAIHQGAALLVDPLAPPSLQSAVARSGPILVLDQVSDPRNVGAILRAAAAFGVAAVITQDRNAPEETGALAKAASGALETVPFLRAVNISRTLVALRAAGFWVIGLDAGGTRLAGPALAERRVALVLGSEGEGLRRLTRDTCDEIAAIAMPGRNELLDSLNVSTAAAIALYELARR
jgi:23S rRNA (guanosine2251-2'-O)-methyltransferase